MFRHYRVILRQLVINTLPSYTSISNAAVGNTVLYFALWPTNAQLFHKLSHCYMFRHYRVILRQLVINTLPSYTSISNAAVGNTVLYFALWPTNAQLFHKLSHCYMFRHYRVILRQLVINTLPSYTSISNAAVGNTVLYFALRPTNAQLFHKLSHCYMFRHYRVILRQLVINTLPSYTSISKAAVGNRVLYFALSPTNAQLFHKLSHSYIFRHHRVIHRQLAINTLPSYTSISNAAVGNTIYN